MGIRGLTSYIREHVDESLKWGKLHDRVLIIDGNNLAHQLYQEGSGLNAAFGGDYDKYASIIEKYFEKLCKCNLRPIVVMDGGHPIKNNKLRTVIDRVTDQLACCLKVNPKNQFRVKIYPALGRVVFVSVLKRMGIQVLQTDYEADEEIAALADALGATVLSNDSDFFIFGTSFVIMDSLNMKNIQKEESPDEGTFHYIPCHFFDLDVFLKRHHLPKSLLPMVGTILGNDYVKPAEFARFYADLNREKLGKKLSERQKTIKAVILWLGRQKSEDQEKILNKVLSYIHDLKKSNRTKIESVLDMYTLSPSNLVSFIQYTDIMKEAKKPLLKDTEGDVLCQKENTAPNDAKDEDLKESDLGNFNPVVLESKLKTKKGTPLPGWFIQLYRENQIPHEIIDILTKNYFISPPQVEVKHLPCSYMVVKRVTKAVYSLLMQNVEGRNLKEVAGDQQIQRKLGEEENGMKVCKIEGKSVSQGMIGINLEEVDAGEGKGEESKERMCEVEGNCRATQDVEVVVMTEKNENDLEKVDREKENESIQDTEMMIVEKIEDSVVREGMVEEKVDVEKDMCKKTNDCCGEYLLAKVENQDKKDGLKQEMRSSGEGEEKSFEMSVSLASEETKIDLSKMELSEKEEKASTQDDDQNEKPGIKRKHKKMKASKRVKISEGKQCDNENNDEDLTENGENYPQTELEEEVLKKLSKYNISEDDVIRDSGSDDSSESEDEESEKTETGVKVPGNVELQVQKNEKNVKGKKSSGKKSNKKKNKKQSKKSLKWFIRQYHSLRYAPIKGRNSETFPSLETIGTLSDHDRKQVFYQILDLSNNNIVTDLPSDLQLIFDVICYWFKKTKMKLNELHILSTLMCFAMFYIIDHKLGRIRNKKAFDNIKAMKEKMVTLREDKDYTSFASIKTLLERVCKEECMLASQNLFEFHHLNPKLSDKNYEKQIVHAFSEYQACIYFLMLTNGLLKLPYPTISVEYLWSGTFCYNIYSTLAQKKNPLSFVSFLLGKGSCIERIIVQLYQVLHDFLKFRKVEECSSKKEVTQRKCETKTKVKRQLKATNKREESVSDEDMMEMGKVNDDLLDNRFSCLLVD
ncbi:single-strand DNA endonuclease protein asteroid [Oratosquilla oratoria]|uniref:single-strand DNA endonuclease protein asteroid n=1 Tax=Oratosquilla oratoria TaxID=337810 RepID=UPI003F764B8B